MELRRLSYSRKRMEISDYIMLKLPLPKVNPNAVSGLSVLASIMFVLTIGNPPLALGFIILAILLDILDGAIARKYNMSSEEGSMVDLFSDRLVDAITFVPFFMPWFYFFILNNIVTMVAFSRGMRITIFFRGLFLFYFFFFHVIA